MKIMMGSMLFNITYATFNSTMYPVANNSHLLGNSTTNNSNLSPGHRINNLDLDYLNDELLAVDTVSKWIQVVSIAISLISNCFVVFCNLKSPTLKPYRYLILNLAICDLLYSFMQIFQAHRRFNMHVWHFGRFLCKAMSLSPTSLTSSMFTMAFMAMERLITIVYPFRPRMKRRTLFIAIAALWALAIGLHVPLILNRDTQVIPSGHTVCRYSWSSTNDLKKPYHLMSFILTYPIPLIIIAVSSIIVVYTSLTRMSRKRRSLRVHVVGGARAKHVNPLVKYKKLFIMFSCILLSFIVTTTPNQALILWMNFAPKEHLSFKEVRFTFFMLYMFAPLVHIHTIANPLIYSFSDEKFRAELRQIVTAIWRSVRPRNTVRRLLNNTGGEAFHHYESPSLIKLSRKSHPDQSEKGLIILKHRGSPEEKNVMKKITATSVL